MLELAFASTGMRRHWIAHIQKEMPGSIPASGTSV